jgi:serine/threonine protein kinase
MAPGREGYTHIGLHMAQRLGECLGKGAFGSVYKAFNWGTGEAVAIKQIKLGDLPKSELRMIEACGIPDWQGTELTGNT